MAADTGPILDVLAAEGVSATFFVVGERLLSDENQATARRAVRLGHRLENHSYSHPHLTRRTAVEVAEEFERTTNAMVAAGLPRPSLQRPPYGDTNDAVVQAGEGLGLTQALWSVDPRDYDSPSPDVLRQRVRDGVQPNQNNVVLLHDAYTRSTAAALPGIIQSLRTDGYCFALLEPGDREEPGLGKIRLVPGANLPSTGPPAPGVPTPGPPLFPPPPAEVPPTPLPQPPVPPSVPDLVPLPASVLRHTAVDAVDAALVLSRAAFPSGARHALLARHDDPADSLATGGLQGSMDAPLLLTPGARLDAGVLPELRRLGVTTVHLLGGKAALSADVERSLVAAGIQTSRLAGQDRVATAVHAARTHFATADVALLARGFATAEPTQAFADALAVGAWASERRWPTLLTHTDRLPGEVANYLRTAGVRQVHVVGGPAAVGERVVSQLKALGIAVTRVAGADRAETALAVARHRDAPTADRATGVLLLDGTGAEAWAPGVASAAYASGDQLQIVLHAGDTLPAATAAWLEAASTPRPLVCGPLTTRKGCDHAAAALAHAGR